MQNRPIITQEEMLTEAELFRSIYPVLIGEIDRVEQARGKLNDFQLMLAVSYTKDGLGVLSYERRQTVNAIFDTFTSIYRKSGRIPAEIWAKETFGCSTEAIRRDEDTSEIVQRMDELAKIIQEKEAELLQLYREFYTLQGYLPNQEAATYEEGSNEDTEQST
ncbi:hypothetical protein ACFO9Q_00375 [Paenibacillus sp. GCM10023252]|uniref:hypothetical protein n=1 Tax=Paenibacillus sp. GCM10023252 TaxID=3252649 RepID=UPI00361C8D58